MVSFFKNTIHILTPYSNCPIFQKNPKSHLRNKKWTFRNVHFYLWISVSPKKFQVTPKKPLHSIMVWKNKIIPENGCMRKMAKLDQKT